MLGREGEGAASHSRDVDGELERLEEDGGDEGEVGVCSDSNCRRSRGRRPWRCSGAAPAPMLCVEDGDGEAVPFPWSGWGDVDHGGGATERFRGGVFSGEEQREEGEMGEKIGGGRRMGKRGGRLGFGEGGIGVALRGRGKGGAGCSRGGGSHHVRAPPYGEESDRGRTWAKREGRGREKMGWKVSPGLLEISGISQLKNWKKAERKGEKRKEGKKREEGFCQINYKSCILI